jgi:transcription termination factor NusA
MTDVTSSIIPKKKRDHENEETLVKAEIVSVKEDLTIVKGIGKSVEEKLLQAGITTVHELASANTERLISIKGIGSETAMKFINAAKQYINGPTLNTFTGSSPKTIIPVQGENKDPSLVNNEKWFDDKFKKPKSGVWYPPLEKELLPTESSIPHIPPLTEDDDDVSVEAINQESTYPSPSPMIIDNSLLSIQSDTIKKKNGFEKLTSEEFTNITSKIKTELTSNEYYLINKTPFLKNVFKGFDLLAVKVVQVTEYLDLLLLVPVKINLIKGPLLVSEDSVKYNFSHETGRQYNRTVTTLQKIALDTIVHSQEAIFTELISEGALLQFFQKYLKLNISVEKTLTNKKLFFRAGPLQYKILIEPILINEGKIGLREKMLPFAYHTPLNLHIIERNTLSGLLAYLEQKYYLLETQQDQETAITRYFKITKSLMEELRLYSIPFIGFGIVFAFCLLSQLPLLIQVFMSVGCGLLVIYSLAVGYFYYKFYKKKTKLQQEFRTPYYLQSHTLDEASLILINEQLTPELMTQFSYECLGKDVPFSLITQLEQNQEDRHLKSTKKKINEIPKGEFFESSSSPERSEPQKKDKLKSKISSFLED